MVGALRDSNGILCSERVSSGVKIFPRFIAVPRQSLKLIALCSPPPPSPLPPPLLPAPVRSRRCRFFFGFLLMTCFLDTTACHRLETKHALQFRLWVERNPIVTQFLQSVFPYDEHREWGDDRKHLPFIHNREVCALSWECVLRKNHSSVYACVLCCVCDARSLCSVLVRLCGL